MGSKSGRHFDVQLTQGFWIGQTEVTQAQWTAVMKTRPWTPADNPEPDSIFGVKEGAKYPASYVSWSDANRFCVRLSDPLNASGELPDGWRFQLPTEAQWEYACRAGGEHYLYPGPSTNGMSDLRDFAWFEWNAGRSVADSDQHPREVALKKPNVWNLYDTSGNLEE
jgi:formylglycine-generating enzyme required for sulfatase activity